MWQVEWVLQVIGELFDNATTEKIYIFLIPEIDFQWCDNLHVHLGPHVVS